MGLRKTLSGDVGSQEEELDWRKDVAEGKKKEDEKEGEEEEEATKNE